MYCVAPDFFVSSSDGLFCFAFGFIKKFSLKRWKKRFLIFVTQKSTYAIFSFFGAKILRDVKKKLILCRTEVLFSTSNFTFMQIFCDKFRKMLFQCEKAILSFCWNLFFFVKCWHEIINKISLEYSFLDTSNRGKDFLCDVWIFGRIIWWRLKPKKCGAFLVG